MSEQEPKQGETPQVEQPVPGQSVPGQSVPGQQSTPTPQQVPTGNPAPAGKQSLGKQSVGIRQIRMTISKVDPLSVLKLGFLISVVLGFMIVVAMAVIWFVLDGIHVFSQMEGLLETLNSPQLLEFMQYLEFGRWMSFAVIIAILDVVLLTALSAVGAFVYNIICSLVGGLRMTVTDE